MKTFKNHLLNELKQSTISSYKEKASKEAKEAETHMKKGGEYSGIASRVLARRKKGLARADKKLEEVNGGPITNDPSPSPAMNKDDIIDKVSTTKDVKKKGKGDTFNPEPTLTPIVTRG